MKDGQISTAKRRAQRRKLQGKSTGSFDLNFNLDPNEKIKSLDEYYDISISDKEKAILTNKYKKMNRDAYNEFKENTKMNAADLSFLFLAVGLQLVRQYVITDFKERLNDQEAANKTKGHIEEHSDRSHRYYKPSLDEIMTNPVPFDANIGSNGALKGGGSLGHRATAIGHDPILGLVFGTANIATSTLTNASFQSYHIGTNSNNRDFFKNNASTSKILLETGNKLLHEGRDGKMIVATSLIKEVIHLKSDVNSTRSLPIPFISAVDTNLASDLANYGIDMGNVLTVGKQAAGSILINTIISMLHRLCYNPKLDCSEKLYEVRTRKILMYSNTIASTSNLIYVSCSGNFKKLDLGGLIVTIYRIATDEKIIREIMREFIDEKVSLQINGELEKVNKEFNDLCKELGY